MSGPEYKGRILPRMEKTQKRSVPEEMDLLGYVIALFRLEMQSREVVGMGFSRK